MRSTPASRTDATMLGCSSWLLGCSSWLLGDCSLAELKDTSVNVWLDCDWTVLTLSGENPVKHWIPRLNRFQFVTGVEASLTSQWFILWWLSCLFLSSTLRQIRAIWILYRSCFVPKHTHAQNTRAQSVIPFVFNSTLKFHLFLINIVKYFLSEENVFCTFTPFESATKTSRHYWLTTNIISKTKWFIQMTLDVKNLVHDHRHIRLSRNTIAHHCPWWEL